MDLKKLEYSLLENKFNKIVFEIIFKSEDGLFDGHFDEFPILPGVTQVYVVRYLLQQCIKEKFSIKTMRAIKFFTPIIPHTKVFLDLQIDSNNNEIKFKFYTTSEKIYSSGSLGISYE